MQNLEPIFLAQPSSHVPFHFSSAPNDLMLYADGQLRCFLWGVKWVSLQIHKPTKLNL